MMAYRRNMNDEVDTLDEPHIEIVGGGRIHRKAGCSCKPPGFFACLWHDIKHGDAWECTHGAKWKRHLDLWLAPDRPDDDDDGDDDE